MHTIRLRGPWTFEPISRFVLQPDGSYKPTSDDLPLPSKANMPADWGGALGREFLGRVRYRRTFQQPTGLESGERVFLVVEPPRSEGCVLLAGKLLGVVRSGEAAGRFDITDRLEYHNQLEIFVDHPALNEVAAARLSQQRFPPGGLIGEVRLEIED